MRNAMYQAEVGDSGYGEDPTVARLEEKAAAVVGTQAALFVPSGCMANLVSVLTHCGRGDGVILGYSTDMFAWEVGAMSAVGGIHPHPLPNRHDGTVRLADIEAAIRPEDVHLPRSRLICLENTNDLCGGVPLTPGYTASVVALARHYRLSVHLDGARLFNASVSLGVDVRELTRGGRLPDVLPVQRIVLPGGFHGLRQW